ncbi:MAG: type II secretion system protein [Phycisphaerae bacterium]|nr:type II secretion system protein [Phycisphaerae bacterium]
MTKRRAFTLIELLVVISIIALLVSILMPALSKARLTAKMTVCKSNQRQLVMGLNLYASENSDRLPESPSRRLGRIGDYHRPYELAWFENTMGFIYENFSSANAPQQIPNAAGLTLGKYLPEVGVYNCTLAPIDNNDPWPPRGSKYPPATNPDGSTLQYGKAYRDANYSSLHSTYTLLWNYQGYNQKVSRNIPQNWNWFDFEGPKNTASKNKLVVQDSFFYLNTHPNVVWPETYSWYSSHPYDNSSKNTPYFTSKANEPSPTEDDIDRPVVNLNAGYIDGSVRQFDTDGKNTVKCRNWGAIGYLTREFK